MKRILCQLLFIQILVMNFVSGVYAQEFLPFSQSNYAGSAGILTQPASIADSRYRFDMILLGIDALTTNNFIAFDNKVLFKHSTWNEDQFKEKYIHSNFDGKDKDAFIETHVVLPSFMVTLNDKSAIALTMRLRGIFNTDNITEDFVRLAYDDFNYEPLLHKELSNANFNVQANTWMEYGFTFATVIANRDKQFFKAGITAKYLLGLASGYMFADNIRYKFDGSDTLSLFQSEIKYGLSENFEKDGFNPFKAISDPGIGFDLGFVYEYRPNIDKFKYKMDGQEGLYRANKEKYLLKVGISLLDIGRIKYHKGYYSQDFFADVADWNIGDIQINTIEDFNDTLRNRFNFSESAIESYSMGLPTALCLQIDYNMGRNFYLNFSPFIALKKGTNIISKTHYYTTYSLTPRYDIKWFGAALPLHADEYGHILAGVGLRLGPLWVGSNSIISTFFSKKNYSADAYVMLKVPIFRSIPKDKDNDGVSNKVDRCPDIAGVWSLYGCPDSDGDGVADQLDDCPYEAGLPALNGCPDRDNDGITDKNDRCPDHPGSIEMKGCPDSDGDGITDFEDECPDQKGSAELHGCPDRDNDGIADKDDMCPDVAGLPQFQGCPFADSDNDGIADEEDACPTIKGPREFNGCPDTDGDGIPDNVDLCPDVAGVKENKGCPPIQKEEIEIIDRAFSNLEFESGKAIIKEASYTSLNELAELMKTRKMWKVELSGHTDNTGTPAKNMELSKNRTQAVKDYLIGRGVEEYRIVTFWYGQDKPIADNKTTAGRQKNRRVEMKITF